MANKWGLKFPDKADRERLRPSEIGDKIAERGWMNEVQIKLAIQDAYGCKSDQADVLLTISAMNGFVEARHEKRGGWKYRVLDKREALAAARSGARGAEASTAGIQTTFDESAPYGDDLF